MKPTFKCSERVQKIFETLTPEQQNAINELAKCVTVNFLSDTAAGSVKIYTSNQNSAVGMMTDKKTWWMQPNGKAKPIAAGW